MTNLSLAGGNELPDPPGTGELPVASLSPLGRLPLTAHRLRIEALLRESPGFFEQLVERLLQGGGEAAASRRAAYPWTEDPLVIALDGTRVLVEAKPTGEGAAVLPLDLAKHYRLQAEHWLTYARTDSHAQVSLLFAGALAGRAPVLAVTGDYDRFFDLGPEPLHLVGLEDQELSMAEVLAAQTGGRWLGIRDYAANSHDPQDGAFTWGDPLAAAAALTNWHRKSGFDPATGLATYAERGGWVRKTATGQDIFPRTDPAVICAVVGQVDGQQQLALGQARAWGPGRFSTFAGFVEAGESLEDAVVREIWEESGGRVVSARYLGSQPWPFPRSLMCGFIVEIDNPSCLKADGREIEMVRWFTPEQLVGAYRSGEVQLPGRASISRRLIEHWLGEPLDEEG